MVKKRISILKKYPFIYSDTTPINTIEEFVIDYYAINFLSMYKENKLQINDSIDIQIESGLIDINIYNNNSSKYYLHEGNDEKWQLSRNIDSLIKTIYKIEYNKFEDIVAMDGRHEFQVLNSKVLKLNNLLFTNQKSNATIVLNEIVNDKIFIALNPEFSFDPDDYQDVFEIMLLVIHRVFIKSHSTAICMQGIKIDLKIKNKLYQIDRNDFIYLPHGEK